MTPMWSSQAMRHKFNLDLAQVDTILMLVHGGYAAGKSHFIGDFLRTEATNGLVRYLNIRGEDGQMSLASLGLGEVGETVETFADFEEAITEYSKLGLRALGVDSVKALSRVVMQHVLGEDRLPVVGGNTNEWSPIHFTMERVSNMLRRAAPYVVCACPSDKSVNQLDGKTYITPDLPGRQAAGSAGWFDFVAYLQSDTTGPGTVMRKLILAPNTKIITRQRLPHPITNDVVVPTGGGGWTRFMNAVHEAMKPHSKK
jgi:hypothetical protein